MPNFLVCVPTGAGQSVAPCVDTAQGATAPSIVVSEVVTPQHLAAVSSWGDVDFVLAGQFFLAGFGILLSIWLGSQAVLAVLKVTREL